MNDLPGTGRDKTVQPSALHNVRNHLSVIVGYCDLLLAEIPESDRKHADVREMRKAAHAAIALLEDRHEAQ